jgi:NAD(P)-dependent dehydrogenase (short-subunit alcohol dehydrogenase family)
MIEQKNAQKDFKGCIINISSISAIVASVNVGVLYSESGSEHGNTIVCRAAGRYDIPVYEVRPGIIHTDMTAAVTEKYDRLIEGGLTLQNRWGYPEDVGKAVLALTEGYFQYSTGQIINVDGGLMAQRL